MSGISIDRGVSSTATSPARTAWRAGLIIAALAVLANLAVLAVARLAGADMSVQPPGVEPMNVGALMVTMTTLIPVVGGTILLVLLRKRAQKSWRIMATLGLVVGILTAPGPFTVGADLATGVGLASMHLVTSLVWFLVVRRAIQKRHGDRGAV